MRIAQSKTFWRCPLPGRALSLAKFMVVMGWSAVVTAVIYFTSLVVGTAVGLPAVPTEIFRQGTISIVVSAVLTITLVTPIAFFASAGRGYLPPMGVTILAILSGADGSHRRLGRLFPLVDPGAVRPG